MRVLFVSRWFPYPLDNGSKLRIYHLLRGLCQHHDVTLLSFRDESLTYNDASHVTALCQRVRTTTWREFSPSSRRSRLSLFSPTPRSFADTYSLEMQRLIESHLSDGSYDLIIGTELMALSYADLFRGLPAILDDPELGVLNGRYVNAESARHRLRNGLTWFKLRRYVARQLNLFSATSVVSKQEKDLLATVAPNFRQVELVPNCIDVAQYTGLAESSDINQLIFTGSFRYFANYDAMTWFLAEIYPKIQSEAGHVHLMITGDHTDLPLPPATDMTLTGFVDDVRPLIGGAGCSLVPLRHGGGTRLKILEAMALRTPVVTTSKGAEGLDVQHGVHLLIADDPEDFAAAVIRIMREPDLRRRLADNGSRLVDESYDWAAVLPRFLTFVDRVVSTTTNGSR